MNGRRRIVNKMLELIEIGNKLVGRKRQVVAEKVYKATRFVCE